jgi:hypothetical protein
VLVCPILYPKEKKKKGDLHECTLWFQTPPFFLRVHGPRLEVYVMDSNRVQQTQLKTIQRVSIVYHDSLQSITCSGGLEVQAHVTSCNTKDSDSGRVNSVFLLISGLESKTKCMTIGLFCSSVDTNVGNLFYIQNFDSESISVGQFHPTLFSIVCFSIASMTSL